MMNIYNGNVTTDDRGYATVTLPEWFEALKKPLAERGLYLYPAEVGQPQERGLAWNRLHHAPSMVRETPELAANRTSGR